MVDYANSAGDAGSRGDLPGNGQPQYGTGRVNQAGAWGGYSGTVTRNPDGSLNYDRSQSGQAADTARYQGMGQAASMREAYQNDYTNANADAANGLGARADQGTAIGLAADQAQYGNRASQTLGQTMLQNGADTQTAAALGTRGGALAQANAYQNAQQGIGSYLQQGNNALMAQKADDMAAGRSLYSGLANDQRAGDTTAQGLHQGQAISQMNNQLTQNQLNDQTQQGYEDMGQKVNEQAQQGSLTSQKTDAGIYGTTSGNDQADKNHAAAYESAGIGAISSAVGKGLTASDWRTKSNVKPMTLAEAAMRRRGGL